MKCIRQRKYKNEQRKGNYIFYEVYINNKVLPVCQEVFSNLSASFFTSIISNNVENYSSTKSKLPPQVVAITDAGIHSFSYYKTKRYSCRRI